MDKLNNIDIETAFQTYINTMDDKTRIAYEIANNHLESSFDLEKSIGFQSFLKTYTNKNTNTKPK